MSEQRHTTLEEAKRVGDAIGVGWTRFDLEQFGAGMDVEFEHGAHDPQTDVTHDDPILTGKIVLTHPKEAPDDSVRLERMETEAEREQAARGAGSGAAYAPDRRTGAPVAVRVLGRAAAGQEGPPPAAMGYAPPRPR